MLSKGTAQERGSIKSGNRTDGLACWTEVIQYFLRTYATEYAIRKTKEDLEVIRQNPNETEN